MWWWWRGGADTAGALIDQEFDYLFFTGSVPVGRKIMEAASSHLTPLTLELGGKQKLKRFIRKKIDSGSMLHPISAYFLPFLSAAAYLIQKYTHKGR